MKITTPADSAYILARLCSETTSDDVIKYRLRWSPTERDFWNCLAAAAIRRFLEALQTSASEYAFKGQGVKLADDFGAALKSLEMRADDLLYGSPRQATKDAATLRRVIAFLDAVTPLARAYGAIRFDPYSNIPSGPRS